MTIEAHLEKRGKVETVNKKNQCKVEDEVIEVIETPRDTNKCCKCLPQWFKSEIWTLLKLGTPLICAYILMFVTSSISLAFSGGLGTIQQAAMSLTISMLNIVAFSVAAGTTTACDTLFSQLIGHGNAKSVGVVLQRGILIQVLFCFPIWSIIINIDPILLLMQQDPEVSRLTSTFLMIFIPGILANFLYQVFAKYLMNQNVVIPFIFFGTAANIICVGANYVFLYVLNWTAEGCMIALSLSHLTLLICVTLYIKISGIYKKTWAGFSFGALESWGQFFKYAFFGMWMMIMEWILLQGGIMILGAYSPANLTALSILANTGSVAYQFDYGISVAISIRIGQTLGKGDVKQVKRVVYVAFVINIILGVIIGTIFMSLQDLIPRLYSSDSEVIRLTTEMLPFYALYQAFVTFVVIQGGIMRGSGRQRLGFLVIMLSYWVIGAPIGYSLLFETDLLGEGFLMGLDCAVVAGAIVYCTIVYKTNWEEQIKLANERIKLQNCQMNEDKQGGRNYGSTEETQFSNGDYDTEKTGLLSGKRKEKTYGRHEKMKLLAKRGAIYLCAFILLGGAIVVQHFFPGNDNISPLPTNYTSET